MCGRAPLFLLWGQPGHRTPALQPPVPRLPTCCLGPLLVCVCSNILIGKSSSCSQLRGEGWPSVSRVLAGPSAHRAPCPQGPLKRTPGGARFHSHSLPGSATSPLLSFIMGWGGPRGLPNVPLIGGSEEHRGAGTCLDTKVLPEPGGQWRSGSLSASRSSRASC